MLVTAGQKAQGPNGKLAMKCNRGPREFVKTFKSQGTYAETLRIGKGRQKTATLKMTKKFRKPQ